MTADYDPDEDGSRSPGLKPLKINYRPEESPPPFLQGRTSDGDGSEKGTPGRSQPNRPDIAALASKIPLIADWPSEEYQDSSTEPKLKTETDAAPPLPTSAATDIAVHALSLIPDGLQSAFTESSSSNKSQHEHQTKDLPPPPATDAHSNTEQTPPRHPHQLPRLSIDSGSKSTDETSPLKKFAIPPSERPVQDSLPALQSLQSPPQSASATSPENNQNLPSLQSALGEQLTGVPAKDLSGRINGASTYHLPPVPGSSPPSRNDLTRERKLSGQFPPPQIPLSPYSYVSPASTKDIPNISSPASQPSPWRPLKSDIHYITSPYEVAPQSSQSAKSPTTEYPTPVDQTNTSSYASNSAQFNGSITTGIYRCLHPGCNAPAFQTQYLLNSHANVHSQDRPHFCPVEGCPRGVGGKGFKRKNEMIRHGLVHDSPGYVCPFCPDQQHKYPRPDNLQRHVRVHHVDKSKDDPELRRVLARRPEGSARGRRRRVNA